MSLVINTQLRQHNKGNFILTKRTDSMGVTMRTNADKHQYLYSVL